MNSVPEPLVPSHRAFPLARPALPRRPGPVAVLAVTLVASEGLYLMLARLDAANGWPSVRSFLFLFASLFAGLAVAHAAAGRAGARALPIVAAGAVLFRLTLLPAGLPPGTEVPAALADDVRGERVVYERFLLFDSDVWRSLWEGHVGAHGEDPFSDAPASAVLDPLGDAERGPSTDGLRIWSDLRDHVNHPDVPTIYPPLAQLTFRLAHALAPGSVLVFKALVTLADLAAGLLIALALRASGRPAGEAVLYLWNPLVVKVFAGSGHVDAVLVLAL
ncbi:MAG TPA: hypothetical protein VMR21_14735, partial [Vicinamibacteria bacterium]|nr:hypothetical protein [Vicinamibacteria bacterium]